MSLLSRFKRAVKKVRLLLSLEVQQWRIASMLRLGSLPGRTRRVSFNDRPGLAACASNYDTASDDSGSSRGHRQLQRAVSYPSDQDDINERADDFIANFRRQLLLERQVSLEVRYYRVNSFDWRSP